MAPLASAHPGALGTPFPFFNRLYWRLIAPLGRHLEILLIRGIFFRLTLSRSLLLSTAPLTVLFACHARHFCNVRSRRIREEVAAAPGERTVWLARQRPPFDRGPVGPPQPREVRLLVGPPGIEPGTP